MILWIRMTNPRPRNDSGAQSAPISGEGFPSEMPALGMAVHLHLMALGAHEAILALFSAQALREPIRSL